MLGSGYTPAIINSTQVEKMNISGLFGVTDSKLMTIVDPSTGSEFTNDKGDAMGIWFTDTESEKCKQVLAAFRNRFKKTEPSAEAVKNFGIDLLTAAATGFENMQDNGKALEFSEELVRNILENSKVIRTQADEFIGNDANFIQSALKD